MERETSTTIETIPVTHSILAADALLALIARVYSLDPPITCSLLRHSWNDTYHLATMSTRYVARIYGVAQHTTSSAVRLNHERPYPNGNSGVLPSPVLIGC